MGIMYDFPNGEEDTVERIEAREREEESRVEYEEYLRGEIRRQAIGDPRRFGVDRY